MQDKTDLQKLSDEIDDLRFNFERAITTLDQESSDSTEALMMANAIISKLKQAAKIEDLSIVVNLCDRMSAILTCLVNNNFTFIQLLSDVLLLSYDHLYDWVNNQLQISGQFDEAQTQRIIDALTEVTSADDKNLYTQTEKALQVLTSQFLVIEENENVTLLVSEKISSDKEIARSQKSIDFTLKIQQDLVFFRELSEEVSYRFPNIKSRCNRILPLAESMNNLAGNPVNMIQLEAAIYLHDVGMTFIPDEVLSKKDGFQDKERNILKKHPVIMANLLRRFDIWNEAAEIVSQHHERIDGTGYPARLTGDRICDGAKIVAILDAFDSMTHMRSDRDFNKTILRAVREIVTNIDQFDPHWTDVFVSVIKQLYSK